MNTVWLRIESVCVTAGAGRHSGCRPVFKNRVPGSSCFQSVVEDGIAAGKTAHTVFLHGLVDIIIRQRLLFLEIAGLFKRKPSAGSRRSGWRSYPWRKAPCLHYFRSRYRRPSRFTFFTGKLRTTPPSTSFLSPTLTAEKIEGMAIVARRAVVIFPYRVPRDYPFPGRWPYI